LLGGSQRRDPDQGLAKKRVGPVYRAELFRAMVGGDVSGQREQAGALATGEDNLRLYLAKDLQDTDSDLVLSMRLHRPF